jgi:hypothetical protein
MVISRVEVGCATLLLCVLTAAAAIEGEAPPQPREEAEKTVVMNLTVESLRMHASPTAGSDDREWFLRCVPRLPQRGEVEAEGAGAGEAGRDATHPFITEQRELRTIIPVVRTPKATVKLGSHPLGAWPGAKLVGLGSGGASDPALTCSFYDVDATAATASVSSATLRLSHFLSAASTAVLDFKRADLHEPGERGEAQQWLSLTLRCDACHEAAWAARDAAAWAAAAEEASRATVRWELTGTTGDTAKWKKSVGAGGSGGGDERSGDTITTAAEHSPGIRGNAAAALSNRSSAEAAALTAAATVTAASTHVASGLDMDAPLGNHDADDAAASSHHRFPWRLAFMSALGVMTVQSVLVALLLRRVRAARASDCQPRAVVKRKHSDFPGLWPSGSGPAKAQGQQEQRRSKTSAQG